MSARVISQMSMDDLDDMNDRQLWARGIHRYYAVKHACSCGLKHVWDGVPFGGWTDQYGTVVMCASPVNPKRTVAA
jgi:hypothetical protein